MSKLDDETKFLEGILKGITVGLFLLPLVVAVMLFGLRYMEKGICEGYEGNTYNLWAGRCVWPPLYKEPIND